MKNLQESWRGGKDQLFWYNFDPRFSLKALLSVFLILALLSTVSSTAWAVRAIGGDGQIQISWIAPTKNTDGSPLTDLAGYNIYRGLSRKEQTEKVNQELISGCNFVDTGLKNGQTYYYIVTAQDFSGNKSAPSELVFATPTILPPSGFTAIGNDGKVKLFWEQSANSSIRGYLLYKTLTPGRGYQKITDVPIECTYFEDLEVENGLNYYYTITSVSEDGQESPYSEEKAATPVTLIPVEPSSLKATYELGVVRLEWAKSSDPQVVGYHVYRRDSVKKKHFQKLTEQLINETSYLDDSTEENKQYLYSVVGVDSRGKESRFPLEVACYTQSLYIASITEDTDGQAKKSGDKITIIMRGEPGCQASFTIEGLIEDQSMEETGPGVYYQQCIIPEGINLADAELRGYLVDTWGNKAMKKAQGKIHIKNDPPPPVLAISGKINSYGWPQINWTPPEAKSFSFVEICRSSSATDFSTDPVIPIKKGISTYTDEKTEAGAIYYYAVRTVDEAGNRSKISEPVRIDLGQNNLSPAIFSVTDDTLGLPVKTGRLIQVTVKGDRGCAASFSIEGIVSKCPLKELRPGLYKGTYLVKSSDQTSGAALIAKFTDHSEREKFAKGKNLLRLNVQANDKEPPNIKRVEHNGQRIAGISGKLVVGDSLGVQLFGEPGGIAFFSLGQKGRKIPMKESRFTHGEYQGTYTIQAGDDGEQINIYGYLSDQAGNITSKMSEVPFSIDTHPVITVKAKQQELPANNKAQTDILVKLEDVNGQPLSNHHLALTLTTTDEYTDVIGGGDLGQEIDGKLAIDFEEITDSFGQLKATYTAGFAAKTAMIIAKDLDTGYAGVGYVTTFIESSLDLVLLPKKRQRALLAAGPGDAVYMILKADPQKITADGRSRTRITVQLLDKNKQPVAKQYNVTFTLSNQEGRMVHSTISTGTQGRGYTYYQAGKSIGTVSITAVANRQGTPSVTGNVSVILMSDAPAKILMAAEPDHLIADSGQSSRLSLTVTDINDNPNPEATIQLRLQDQKGKPIKNGDLSDSILQTDRNGETGCTYRAGEKPGTVRIMAKVSSRIPTSEELLRARGSLFIPLWEEEEERDNFDTSWMEKAKNTEGTVQEWFKAEGDEIQKGEPLARVEIDEHGTLVLKAPYNGKLLDIKVLRGEDILVGQTIGIMEIEEE